VSFDFISPDGDVIAQKVPVQLWSDPPEAPMRSWGVHMATDDILLAMKISSSGQGYCKLKGDNGTEAKIQLATSVEGKICFVGEVGSRPPL
jgi:hypothetical protein